MTIEPALADLARRLAVAVGLPGPAIDGGGFDWARWLDLAREHDVAPLLAARDRDLPAAIRDELIAEQARWSHETLFRAAELRAVLDLLAPLGEVIVLKGAAMALTGYDDAAERVTSDLDLLVAGRAVRRAAVDALAARGYRPRHRADDAAHDLGVHSAVAELEVDLHVDLTRPPLGDDALADAWARRVRVPALGGVDVLAPSWRALHAAVHALADPIGSPLLRNLLETGWLAARLDDAGRAELVALARRAGVADRAAQALALAHRLFGSPALLGEPRRGGRAFWAWRRLGWRYGAGDGARRAIEHVAEYHLRRLDAGGRDDRDPRPLLATVVEVAAGQLGRGARAALRRLRAPTLERVDADVEAIGDQLLIHALDTGDVHVLRDDAIAAWDEAITPATEAALRRRLTARGLPEARAAAAIAALVDCRLLG